MSFAFFILLCVVLGLRVVRRFERARDANTKNRHEPIRPGGDEIAAAVRPLDSRRGVVRAMMVVFGTLVGVDVFLR